MAGATGQKTEDREKLTHFKQRNVPSFFGVQIASFIWYISLEKWAIYAIKAFEKYESTRNCTFNRFSNLSSQKTREILAT